VTCLAISALVLIIGILLGMLTMFCIIVYGP
jgi:hypothetical protein